VSEALKNSHYYSLQPTEEKQRLHMYIKEMLPKLARDKARELEELRRKLDVSIHSMREREPGRLLHCYLIAGVL
jgi:hypothetical protein